MFNVVVLDENYSVLVKIFNILKNYDAYKIRGIYGDIKSAKQFLDSEKVDILIINYNENPSLINLIKEIRSKKQNIKIILVINKSSDVSEFLKKEIYIDEIIFKKFLDDKIIDTIEKVSKIIVKKEDIINIRIEKILKKFCFNKTSVGYYNILSCLNYCIINKYDYITKYHKLCEDVSKLDDRYTTDQIRWNLNKTIKSMYRLTDEEVFEKYFPLNAGITPKSFLNEIIGIYYTIYRE